jgi:hypothetical protein
VHCYFFFLPPFFLAAFLAFFLAATDITSVRFLGSRASSQTKIFAMNNFNTRLLTLQKYVFQKDANLFFTSIFFAASRFIQSESMN